MTSPVRHVTGACGGLANPGAKVLGIGLGRPQPQKDAPRLARDAPYGRFRPNNRPSTGQRPEAFAALLVWGHYALAYGRDSSEAPGVWFSGRLASAAAGPGGSRGIAPFLPNGFPYDPSRPKVSRG